MKSKIYRLIKTGVSFTFCVFIVVEGTKAQQKEDIAADNIIEMHVKASGGRKALEAIQTLYMEGSQNYYGKSESIKFSFERGKIRRFDIVFAGQKGWWVIMNKEGGEFYPWKKMKYPNVFSDSMVRRLQANLELINPLLHYKEEGAAIEFLQEDSVNFHRCFKLQLTTKKDMPSIFWIDKESLLLLQSIKHDSIINSKGNKVPAFERQKFENYRGIDGIMFPFTSSSVTFINNVQMGSKEIFFNKIIVNQPLDKKVFQLR